MPGTYLVDLTLGNESRDIDVVHDAISFEIAPGDVFGSGKLPPKDSGPICWFATWDLQTNEIKHGTCS